MLLPDWLRLACYALAVFRITHLLWWENGPWDVFDWLRSTTGIACDRLTWYEKARYYYGMQTEGASGTMPDMPQLAEIETVRITNGSFFAELLNCPLCLSGWVTIPAVVAFFLRIEQLDWVATWLAVWAVSLLLFGWERVE